MSDRSYSKSSSRSSSRSSHSTHKTNSPVRLDGSTERARTKSSESHKSKSPPSVKHRQHSSSRSRSRSRSRSHKHRDSRRRHRDSRSRSRSYSRQSSRHQDGDRRRRSYSHSPFSGRRRQGDRERPKESRCIGVFGLSLETSERHLRDVFGQYGPIEDIQIVYDYHSGKSRGFAFLYMKHIEDAIEAKENAPGTEIDGRRIRVDYSITERGHTPTPGMYMGRVSGRGGGGGGRRSSRSPYRRRNGHRSRSYSRSSSPRR